MQKFKLIFSNKTGIKERIVSANPLTLGRSESCSYRYVDEGVSRQHLNIFLDGEKVYIRDLGSKNGTFLNNEMIEANQDLEYNPGDTLTLGLSMTEIVIIPIALKDRFTSISNMAHHRQALAEAAQNNLVIENPAIMKEKEQGVVKSSPQESKKNEIINLEKEIINKKIENLHMEFETKKLKLEHEHMKLKIEKEKEIEWLDHEIAKRKEMLQKSVPACDQVETKTNINTVQIDKVKKAS